MSQSAAPAPSVARRTPAPRDADEDEADEPRSRANGRETRRPRKKGRPQNSVLPLAIILGVIGVPLTVGAVILFQAWRTDRSNIVNLSNAAPPPATAPATPVGAPPPGVSAARMARAAAPAPAPAKPVRVEDWLQDIEQAKLQGSKDKKDLLIAFVGTDWSSECIRLNDEVFAHPQFGEQIGRFYVPVLIDFPHDPSARARVQSAARNLKLQEHYRVKGYPTLVLTDAQGLPYGFDGYRPGGVGAFAGVLARHLSVREERDALHKDVTGGPDGQKLDRAKDLLSFLRKKRLIQFYGAWVDEWAALARRQDTQNEHGYVEIFFDAQWTGQLVAISGAADPDNERGGPGRAGATEKLAETVRRFDEWKKEYRFKDPDLAVRLHLRAATLLHNAKKDKEADKYLRDALAYTPSDVQLQKDLKSVARYVRRGGSGTGFAVAAGGYIMTNNHVIEGDGKLLVRFTLAKGKVDVPADIIATDEKNDLALIRTVTPPGVVLRPVPLVRKRRINRGETVAALGFPLFNLVGSGMKLTTGVVSTPPEDGVDGMMLLDAKVNPGNSGGPLCDERGNVLGIVTAKSLISEELHADSYGMARPSWDIDAFLHKRFRDYKPVAVRTKKLASWADVDRLVSPSVVLIMRRPAEEKPKE